MLGIFRFLGRLEFELEINIRNINSIFKILLFRDEDYKGLWDRGSGGLDGVLGYFGG